MSLRNVTLTAVAALSFGMAAHAQTRTITVPMNEPGAATPAPAGPGTTLTRNPDGTTTVDTTAVPAPDAGAAATAETPAPAASDAEAATAAETGTAATGIDPATPQPTATPEEPPAAPQEGLPAAATDAGATDAAPADAEAPAEAGAPGPDAEAQPVEEPTESQTAASGEGEATATDATATDATDAPAADAAATTAAGTDGDAAADTASQAAPPGTESEGETATAAEADATAAAPEGEPAIEAEAPTVDAAGDVEAGPASESMPEAGATPDAEPEPGEDTAQTNTGSEGGAPAQEEAHAETPGASHEQHIEDVSFSFEGPFGKFDQFQLQRGLQVYTEVCAACHGMKQVPLRTLADPGGPELPMDQVRAYAAEMSIMDAETGEDRPRLPTDHFPTVTGEGMGPDLSLMAKARAGFHGPYGSGLSQLFNGIGGPEYIVSILTGYTGEEMEQAGTVLYENTAFPGGWISMPPPLADDQVTFEDGAPADAHSASMDLAAFLMWTAEPKMMDRKQIGLVSVLFLIVLWALLYLTNKRLWWRVKHRPDVPGDGM